MEESTNIDLWIIWGKVAEYAKVLGVESIKDLPEAWVVEFGTGNKWKLAVNGHDTPVPTPDIITMPDFLGEGHSQLPPYGAVVWYQGWPAGVFAMTDGEWIANSEFASPSQFVSALQTEIDIATGRL